MSCNANTQSLLQCIRRVCAAAASHVLAIMGVSRAANALEADLAAAEAKLDCVLNGAVGQSCGGIPSLSEALDRLNATSIGSLASYGADTTAGQTAWTLGTAPAGAAYLELRLNGAILDNPSDYTVSGTGVSFVDPIEIAGERLSATVFVIA